jgi:hypothetical protein
VFFFISYLQLCGKSGLCGTREEQITCTVYRSFCAGRGRRGSFTVKGARRILQCSLCSGNKSAGGTHVVAPASTVMPLYYRISHNLLFFRRSPALLRCMTKSSSGVGVGARNATAVFHPPATDIHFELSPVPPNPLGEGRWIKTAAALVIGCVVCRGWSLFTELAE